MVAIKVPAWIVHAQRPCQNGILCWHSHSNMSGFCVNLLSAQAEFV